MAMRLHLLAVRDADPARVRPRLNVEVWPLGDWTWGLASVWGCAQHEASWRLALVSRERRCVAYRATTVDDAFVDVEAFANGEPVAHFVHHYGGLLSERGAVEGNDGINWDEPLPPARLALLDTDESWDPDLVALASEGRPLREAAQLVASRRAEQLTDAVKKGTAIDRTRLEAVLLGRPHEPPSPADDDPLEAWADVPELLEAAGLTGFRGALRERIEAHEAEEAAATASQEKATPGTEGDRRRWTGRRLVGCAIVIAILLLGTVIGFRQGGALGAVGGLALAILPFVTLIGLRLWRAASGLRKLVPASAEGPKLSARVRAQLAPLLGSWRTLSAHMGVPPPGGLFGALYPAAMMPPTDAPSRGLVAIAGDPQRAAQADRRIRQLWLSLVDAELTGRPRAPLKRQFEELTQWLSRQTP